MTSLPAEDGFAAAVGMTGGIPLRVEHASGVILAEGEVTQPYALVGADPRCEVTLNDPAVPGRVACLQVIDGLPTLFPLDTLRGVPLRTSQPWSVAGFKLSRTDSDEACDWGSDPTRAALPPGSPDASLKWVNGPGAKNPWGISRRVTFLGRNPACEIHLDSPEVADVHAYLVVTTDAIWVVDVLSESGTAVNGERVRVAQLRDGDELTLGSCRFRCRLDLWGEIPAAEVPPTDGEELVPLSVANPQSFTFDVPPSADPSAVALVQYMTALQGHLMEQFRQSIAGMMTEFGRMQREQMEATQKGLARMAELNTELHKLYQQTREASPLTAQSLYQPLPESETPEDSQFRYEWVVSRIASMEAERTGILDRLRGLFVRPT